jgi:transcriptional regulator with XRE-family HTH domain
VEGLGVDDGKLSYNLGVTPDELWLQVGRVLRDRREENGWNPSDVYKRAGLDPKTIQSIEVGEPGQVDKLTQYAEAFGLSIVDVISAVLERTKTPLSPEAVTLLRHFEGLGVLNRRILVELAQSLFELEERAKG